MNKGQSRDVGNFIDRIAATRSPDMEWLESRIGRMDEINAQEHREREGGNTLPSKSR